MSLKYSRVICNDVELLEKRQLDRKSATTLKDPVSPAQSLQYPRALRAGVCTVLAPVFVRDIVEISGYKCDAIPMR